MTCINAFLFKTNETDQIMGGFAICSLKSSAGLFRQSDQITTSDHCIQSTIVTNFILFVTK